MLAEPEQRPRAAIRRGVSVRGAGCVAAPPGVEQACDWQPVGFLLLAGAAGRRPHQAMALVGQPLRQLVAVEGKAHQQLGRVAAQMAAESRQAGLGLEVHGAQALRMQLLQHQADGQIVGEGDGRAVAGMAVAPQHHAGPARQLLRQRFQIVFPARRLETRCAQRLQDGFQRILRQSFQGLRPGDQAVQVEMRVVAGARQPGGVETAVARRVGPGDETLVEVRGEMADEIGTDFIQHVAAGQPSQQAAQGEVRSHAAKEADEPALCVLAQGVDGPRRRVRLRAGRRRQPRRAGVPQPAQARRRVRPSEQARAQGGWHLGVDAFEYAQFVHLPSPGGGRRHAEIDVQCGQQDVAAAEARAGRLVGAQFRRLVERGGEIVGTNAAFAEQGAIACQRQETVGAGRGFRCSQRVAEGKVLEAVQGIMVHEVADRRLRGQHVLEPVRQAIEQGAQGLEAIHAVSPRTARRSAAPRRRPVAAAGRDTGRARGCRR